MCVTVSHDHGMMACDACSASLLLPFVLGGEAESALQSQCRLCSADSSPRRQHLFRTWNSETPDRGSQLRVPLFDMMLCFARWHGAACKTSCFNGCGVGCHHPTAECLN